MSGYYGTTGKMMAGDNLMRRETLLESWRLYLRARRTIRCRDCATIPKMMEAGRVVASDSPYQIMHNGIKIQLGGYHGAWMAEIIAALKGHHEPQEERIFHEVLKVLPAGAIMLELGSYWAYYSMWFQSSVANARTYLIEPVPHKLQVGIGNYRLNNLSGDFRNAFIGAVSKEHGRFADWDGSVVDVPCVAIDDFLGNEKIDFLDVLHADIQGAELEMLQGCKRSLANNKIGYVFLSTHADKHGPCLARLRQSGYEVVVEHSVEESCSGDGLIVARSLRAPRIPPIEITKGNAKNRIRESLGALTGLLKKNNRRLWRAIRSRKDDVRQDALLPERRRIDNA